MTYDSSQFSSLVHEIGNACNDKDLEMVTDALAVALGNIGISYEIPHDEFLHKILRVITQIYIADDILNNADGESVH